MAEFALKPRTAFAGLAVPGRYGAERAGEPAVVIAERSNLAVRQFSAFRGKTDEIAKASLAAANLELPRGPKLKAARGVVWLGVAPSQWLAIAEGKEGKALLSRLSEALSSLASVVDQSDAKAILRVSGARARDALAKGCSLDLDASAFTPQNAATTQIALIPCQIWMIDETPTFELSVPLSYVESFWSWLTGSAAEFGYEVKRPIDVS